MDTRTWRPTGEGRRPRGRAFTLIELLVVISIIGILAATTVPALRGLGRSSTEAGVTRQVLDDLGLARLRAINDRTTVYMVFVPPLERWPSPDSMDPFERVALTNLLSQRLTSYALVALRSLGDQPGQESPRYLTEWRPLPEGMIFPPSDFEPESVIQPNRWVTLAATNRPLEYVPIPFPTARSAPVLMPAVGFTSLGQVRHDLRRPPIERDVVVRVTEGSVFYPRDQRDRPTFERADIVETAPDRRLNFRINWLTGRAALEREVVP